jgi:hypothetical protein
MTAQIYSINNNVSSGVISGQGLTITPGYVSAGTSNWPNNYGQITLGNMGNLLQKVDIYNSNVKKYEIIETTEDLLALSCTWFRLRKEKQPTGIGNLLSNELFLHVTEEDRSYASTVRDYYSKKLMMLTLKETKLSVFRQDLKEFIHGDAKKFLEKSIPMVYKLPEFYEFDSTFDVLKRELVKEIEEDSNKFIRCTNTRQQSIRLTPITSLMKNTKRIKTVEYWFKDHIGRAYMVSIEPKNPLRPLWDREFARPEIVMSGSTAHRVRDDLQYYQLLNYQFE